MLILQYKVSFTYDRLGPYFGFVYIYARIAVLWVTQISYQFLPAVGRYHPLTVPNHVVTVSS